MRDSIAGAWLLGVVLTFMAIFIAYIAISFNYSNAFQMKTKMVNVIEQYQGINSTSLQMIDNIIHQYNYTIKSKCPVRTESTTLERTFLGVTDGVVTKKPSDRHSYCVYRSLRDKNGEKKYYYNVIVFFNFSLPILGDMFTFKIESETNVINYPNDPYFR